MKLRVKSTGYRQRAWDCLRAQSWRSVQALADHIQCSADGLRGYIALLETHGYVRRVSDGSFSLISDTGQRAPSASVHTGDLRDWNKQPTMSGRDLEAVIEKSGLSLSGWLRAHGKHPAGTTRLRQMINGQRPVSEDMALIARDSTPISG